ncbi:hypothetical protein [Blautia hydrogenotrophica]|uniref:hypothetical protein n=1 Tax=Blautia hydrogenotrophica TaxID=53443 RepID=UPI003A7F2FE8
MGLLYQGISMCCRNKRKTCGGYMWSFASLEDVRKYSEKRWFDGKRNYCIRRNSKVMRRLSYVLSRRRYESRKIQI